jgi:hypothetical protein
VLVELSTGASRLRRPRHALAYKRGATPEAHRVNARQPVVIPLTASGVAAKVVTFLLNPRTSI